jgi:Flp pilus assembly pilin Flp
MTVQSRRLGGLMSDRLGVTVIEYAIIACLMGPVVIAAFTTVWAPLSPGFTIIGNFLTSTAAAGF